MYSTIASPEVRLRKCVFACTNPRANRNLESTSPTYNWYHHTDWMKHCIPAQNSETASLLPLNFPVVKTRFLAKSRPTSCGPTDLYRPWTRPTSLEVGSGPSVNGSSKLMIQKYWLVQLSKQGGWFLSHRCFSCFYCTIGFFPDSVSRK